MRTSMPALRAVCTAAFDEARSGSMIPTMPTKPRSATSDIGSSVIAWISPSPTKRAAKASTRRPFWPIRSLSASMPVRACAIDTGASLSGPPDWLHRARTTSGPPLTSWMTRSTPSTGTLWNVAMNLYSESNGTSASRG
jgi:hypothetical protein